jgi:hypothetical protein
MTQWRPQLVKWIKAQQCCHLRLEETPLQA